MVTLINNIITFRFCHFPLEDHLNYVIHEDFLISLNFLLGQRNCLGKRNGD